MKNLLTPIQLKEKSKNAVAKLEVFLLLLVLSSVCIYKTVLCTGSLEILRVQLELEHAPTKSHNLFVHIFEQGVSEIERSQSCLQGSFKYAIYKSLTMYFRHSTGKEENHPFNPFTPKI